MGGIQELDDSLAATGQSTQQQHMSWVFMGVVVLVVMSSLQKHWYEFHLVAAWLLSLLNLHLEDPKFALLSISRTGNTKGKAGPTGHGLLGVHQIDLKCQTKTYTHGSPLNRVYITLGKKFKYSHPSAKNLHLQRWCGDLTICLRSDEMQRLPLSYPGSVGFIIPAGIPQQPVSPDGKASSLLFWFETIKDSK